MSKETERKQQAERNRKLDETIGRRVESAKGAGGVPTPARTPHELSEGGAIKQGKKAKSRTR